MSKKALEAGSATVPFALNLLSHVSKEGENTFCSPASISLALGMTLAGANAETLEEMRKVFFNGVEESVVHDCLAALVESVNSGTEEVALHTANRLYAMAGFGIEKKFLATLAEKYASDFKQVDFVMNAEAARVEINSWVSEVTRNRINDLIAQGILNADTRLVIVNAIYFKGQWMKQFEPSQTKDEPFHLNSKKEISVPMMNIKAEYRYGEADDCRVLVMPYRSRSLSFVIILPNEIEGLAGVMKAMTPDKLVNLVRNTRNQEVILKLPKFKMEASFDLTGTLQEMGAGKMFDGGSADFTRITTEPPGLYVSKVIHKAFIEVNEEGSEAAAATAVVIRKKRCIREPRVPVSFEVDRPCGIAIWGTNQNCPIFLGLLQSPKC